MIKVINFLIYKNIKILYNFGIYKMIIITIFQIYEFEKGKMVIH